MELVQAAAARWWASVLRGRAADPPAPRRVWFLVGVTWALGLGLAAAALTQTTALPVSHPLAWPLLAVAVVFVQRIPIRLHVGRDTVTLDLFGVPVLVAGAVSSVRSLLLATLLANLLGQLLRTRATVRVLFNLANQLAGVSLAVLVLRAMLAGSAPTGFFAWGAMVAAMLAYELLTDLGVLCAVGLSEGWPGRDYIRDLVNQLAFLIPLNCALAITAVAVYQVEPWTLMVFAALCLTVAMLCRYASRLRARYSDLQALYDFTVKLTDEEGVGDILAAALEQTRVILRCRHAELTLAQGDRAYRFELGEGGTLAEGEVDLTDLELYVLDTRRSRLISVGHASPALLDRGFPDAMAVPVPINDTETAVLVVADRYGDAHGTFEADDLTLLQALAAHLGTALLSCGRLDRLRDEVAAREHEAYHDSLTGLANRSLFNQVLTAALKSLKGSRMVAVMLMDLDGFKEVNDTLGHHTGDRILQIVAERLDRTIGPACLAARLGGDEFAVLVPGAHDLDEVTAMAEGLLRSVSESVVVEGMELAMRGSLGVAVGPLHGGDADTLLRRADVAMYAGKRSSRALTIYNPEIDHHSTRRLVVASALQKAVSLAQLDLWYQPVADMATGDVCGVEGLLRWYSPELGSVMPTEFIPVAEQSGLIEPLTWWVVETALRDARAWREMGYHLDMAVNISARSLYDSHIVERLGRMLADAGHRPSNLTLEITESSMMSDLGRSEKILRRLADSGVRVAIDDFGTGYSSLSRLKVLPVSVVKVDRSFVKNMIHDTGDQAIVRSTIELARVMGHDVVAEGVEDQSTWDLLARFGCTHAQGYHLAAPMTGQQFRAWLTARQRPTLAEVRRLSPRVAGA